MALSSCLCLLPHYSFRFMSAALSGQNINKSWMQDIFLVGNDSALPYMSSCVSDDMVVLNKLQCQSGSL